MIEIQYYAGLCKCNRKLDTRMVDAREKEKDQKSKVVAWIIYGFCKRCKVVYAQGLFVQEDRPVENRDFIMKWGERVK